MINIAIDGPSGAGKSTVARLLADKLNLVHLDTGAMYRCVGLAASRRNIVNDEAAVCDMLNNINMQTVFKGGAQRTILDGEDVSDAIREHSISKAGSDVSKYRCVREKLVALQREFAVSNDVVIDGRDITSYVLPNAKYKFYLTADSAERANRRWKELSAKGQSPSYDRVLGDIEERDRNDMNRALAPLIKTADSVEINSTNLSAEQVVEIILKCIRSGDVV